MSSNTHKLAGAKVPQKALPLKGLQRYVAEKECGRRRERENRKTSVTSIYH